MPGQLTHDQSGKDERPGGTLPHPGHAARPECPPLGECSAYVLDR
jgi:hypothetical protein